MNWRIFEMANKTITCSKCGTEATYVTTGKKGTI